MKRGIQLKSKPQYTRSVKRVIEAINKKSFSNSYCLHMIYDREIVGNMFLYGSGHIPMLSTANGCPNILIWFNDLEKILGELSSGRLPREGKYVIFTSSVDAGNGTLQRLVEKEMYLDVWLTLLRPDFAGEPKQLGIAVGENGRVDLQGRTLHVVGVKNPPFTVLDAQGRARGVEVRVVRELADALNFRWQFHEPRDKQLWGHFDRQKRAWTGLKGELAEGKADIGVAMLYMALDHYEAFQISSPYTSVCLTFLVPAPKRVLGNWDALLKPLRPETWASFAAIAVLFTGLFYLTARRKRSLVECTLYTVQMAAQVSGREPGSWASQRVLCVSWLLGCFLVANLYNSELSAWMVAQVTETPLRTVGQLARSRLTWGRLDTDMLIYLQQAGTSTAAKLARKFRLAASEQQMEDSVQKGGYGIFVHVLSDGYPSGAEFLSPAARRSLTTLPDCMASRYISIGMRRGLPLQRATSVELRRLQEAGLLQQWQARDVRKFGDRADYRAVADSHDEQLAPPLGLDNLAGAFAFLLIGFAFAAAAFAAEIAAKPLHERLLQLEQN
ncbi:glutamate receptor ionotropic, delta-2-like [Cloeon dipterum]|uniref:glutamate receptor ionotropic, delta-2-like n=1 Tax=Cloeon dipterum TaxID=197152 RepID=UPI00321FD502